VAFDDIDAAEKAITAETAAILIEPVQGEGGIRPVPTQSLKRLRQLCDQHGLLLIFDEVQCGIGRTGKLFAHEWAGVAPDLMAIAKGIGGGFPMVLVDGFLEDVQRKALLLKQGLAAVADEFPEVIEGIRGTGLMLGLKCAMPNTKVNMALRDQHLLAVPAGDNVIRLLPPLTVTDEEIGEALKRIRVGQP
ncbi:MAG: aminotransferase class III-fold pyridoxal phosphate-dependent enzyme, partial [Mesorhizobium sp.]